jgi:hypothetical protein
MSSAPSDLRRLLEAATSTLRGYWLLLRIGGLCGLLRYERERRVRERFYGRRFDPKLDGLDLLHFVGATPEEIGRAREKGLA